MSWANSIILYIYYICNNFEHVKCITLWTGIHFDVKTFAIRYSWWKTDDFWLSCNRDRHLKFGYKYIFDTYYSAAESILILLIRSVRRVGQKSMWLHTYYIYEHMHTHIHMHTAILYKAHRIYQHNGCRWLRHRHKINCLSSFIAFQFPWQFFTSSCVALHLLIEPSARVWPLNLFIAKSTSWQSYCKELRNSLWNCLYHVIKCYGNPFRCFAGVEVCVCVCVCKVQHSASQTEKPLIWQP